MGLYLTIFHDDQELAGVEVGRYTDFGAMRSAVVSELEGGDAGSRFPTLIMHSDCDGEWTPLEAVALEQELLTIAQHFKSLPPVGFNSTWQAELSRTLGVVPHSL